MYRRCFVSIIYFRTRYVREQIKIKTISRQKNAQESHTSREKAAYNISSVESKTWKFHRRFESRRRTAERRGEAGQDGTPMNRFTQRTTVARDIPRHRRHLFWKHVREKIKIKPIPRQKSAKKATHLGKRQHIISYLLNRKPGHIIGWSSRGGARQVGEARSGRTGRR